jgi:hypothetical protein
MTTKCCTGCGRDLPLEEFPADASKSDGHHTRCRTCKRGGSQAGTRRENQERQHRLAEARTAALERLAERHDQEFVKLYYSEAVARGIVEPHGSVDDSRRGLVA